jgi:ABC-type Na+ efflux pump permease subunit
MKSILKDKKVLIALLAVSVLIVLGVIYIVLANKSSKNNQDANNLGSAIESVPTLAPDQLGLKLEYSQDKKSVIVSISKKDGIKAAEATVTYNTEGNILRGFNGSLDFTKTPASKDFTLGTCSSGVCKIDKGVSDIKAVLKITKDNGNVYQSESTLSAAQ